MFSKFIKKSVLPALAAAALVGLLSATSYAEGGGEKSAVMTKEQVEQIVHDYIVKNPMFILEAVDNYQKTTMQARQETTLKENRSMIFEDQGSPFIGNEKGDVTVVEFFDYNCGYCKKTFPGLKKLVDEDKNVKVIFKDFPILGPSSETAAKWALAADRQKKYFDFHIKLMEHKGPIDDALLESISKDIGMDANLAKTDTTASDVLLQIEKNRTLANNLGITGTPAFVVGDKVVPGYVDADRLKEIVAEQRGNKKDDKKQ